MDYEEKYNKALEAARKVYQSLTEINDQAGMEDMVHIFPELHESEDERIRRKILELVSISGNGNDWEEINTWLEKQKYSFENGVELGIMQEQARQELGWPKEKQKENPKTADSIPADCVSNAKCEDRWHKVKDSLPDSAREVLCKDAIGNYFIGRYYSKGVWEVSMYDDCDKSNEDNPPVVMWIDITSEKQKEQNTKDKECTDFTIYHPVKNGKGEYECIPYSFYGSLTSFSSKSLIDFLRTCFYTKEECEEWIKQQKEQKPILQEDFDAAKHEALWEEQNPIDANNIINAILSALSSGLETDEILKARGFTYDDVEKWLNSKRNPAIEHIRCQNKIFENPEKYGLSWTAEWSEEDNRLLDFWLDVIDRNDWRMDDDFCKASREFINRLKSLRPSWKPSREQMEALRDAINDSP